jgi:SRSO17 transposase
MHGPREEIATISFVDQYCSTYQELFPEVRSFECFKFLHVGMISEIKRKSLPAIALISRLDKSTAITSFFS